MNIVGDIAGNYKTLLALLAKMPDHEVISLGDVIDRGPRSKECLQWFIDNKQRVVLSNHDHMMFDLWKSMKDPTYVPWYSQMRFHGLRNIWLDNGGYSTFRSYCRNPPVGYMPADRVRRYITRIVPEAHISFIEGFPEKIETDQYIFTHAPYSEHYHGMLQGRRLTDSRWATMDYEGWINELEVIWNRNIVVNNTSKVNVYGHNGYKVPAFDYLNDDDTNGENLRYIGIDTSRVGVLTGYNTETKLLYQQSYID